MISEARYKDAIKNWTQNLFRFVLKSLKDRKAAEDIVQDCFLKLWENRKKVQEDKIKSWLFTVAHNHLINYVKGQSRLKSIDLSKEQKIVYQDHDFELKRIIDRELGKLPAIQKSIILLRDMEGYGYKEIGEILQLSESQVKVYLFRARLKIKNSIKSLNNVL